LLGEPKKGAIKMGRNLLNKVVLFTVLIACLIFINLSELQAQTSDYFRPIPKSVPVIKNNPITPEKTELGKMLYFDPRLSASGLISCNTCHNLSIGGDDNLPTSVGHGWAKGPRNAPTVFNAVFNIAQFWDGRAEDLKEQAKGPIQAAVEMNSTPEFVVETLKSMPEYVRIFKQAFPEESDPVSFDNITKAIEAFEATLLTPSSRFDQYLEGKEDMIKENEKQGLKFFIDKGCVACHAGVNVGGESYHSFGVVERPGAVLLPPDDKGRYAVTKTASDEYVFRASPLRNVALTAPYFHSGQVWDLEQAVMIMGDSQLGEEITKDEAKLITEFLHTLTGERPQIELPILPARTEETPKPKL
jgi:cytochrome c peroxidase